MRRTHIPSSRNSIVPTSAPPHIMRIARILRRQRGDVPPATPESAAGPVTVNVSTVVVRSGTASLRRHHCGVPSPRPSIRSTDTLWQTTSRLPGSPPHQPRGTRGEPPHTLRSTAARPEFDAVRWSGGHQQHCHFRRRLAPRETGRPTNLRFRPTQIREGRRSRSCSR